MPNKALWCASLSDGTTLYEGKGDFAAVPGGQTPWSRLLSSIVEKNLTLTSLSLYTEDGRHWSLPSAGRNPKFRQFASAPKPIGYRFYRVMGMDQTGKNAGVEDRFAVVEAQYPSGLTIQLWVEDGTLNCWTLLA